MFRDVVRGNILLDLREPHIVWHLLFLPSGTNHSSTAQLLIASDVEQRSLSRYKFKSDLDKDKTVYFFFSQLFATLHVFTMRDSQASFQEL